MNSKLKYKFVFTFTKIKASKVCSHVQIAVRRGDKSVKSSLFKNISKQQDLNEEVIFCTTIANVSQKKQADIQIKIMQDGKQMKKSIKIDFAQIVKKDKKIFKQFVYKYEEDVDLAIGFYLDPQKQDSKNEQQLEDLSQSTVRTEKDLFKSSKIINNPKSTKTITWLDENVEKENTQPNMKKNKDVVSLRCIDDNQCQESIVINTNNKCVNCQRLQKLLDQSKNKEVGLMEKLVASEIMSSSKQILDLPQQSRQHVISLRTQNQTLKRQNIQLTKQLMAVKGERDKFCEQAQVYLADSIKSKQKMMRVVNQVIQNAGNDQQLLHLVTDVLYRQ